MFLVNAYKNISKVNNFGKGRAMKIIKALKRGGFSIVLFSLFLTSKVFAGELVVSWNPNSEEDLKGYKIHYGNSSGNYNNTIDVGKVTTYIVSNINEGIIYYFVLTAYDEAGNESEYSDEVFAFIERNDATFVSEQIDKICGFGENPSKAFSSSKP